MVEEDELRQRDLKRQELRRSTKKCIADTSEILSCIPQLQSLFEHNEMVEASIEKRSRELESKEKELQSLSLDLEKRSRKFEAEKAEAGDLKKLAEEYTQELRSTRNQLTVKLDSLTRVQIELDSKDKLLRQVMADLGRRCKEARQVQDRKREIEDETAKKKKELALIVDKIKESGKQFVTVDEELESRRRDLEIQSMELLSKERELECVREAIKLSNSELELKVKKVESLNSSITVCGEQLASKSEELGEIQRLIEQHAYELGVMQNQRDSTKLMMDKLSEELVAKEKRHKEIVETICSSTSEMEERAREIKAAETEANDLSLKSERFRQEVEVKEKELNLVMNQIESEENKLVQLKREMEEETHSKKKDLVLIISKIKESGEQLAAVDEQLESQRRLLELQSMELLPRDMELECVAESSKGLTFDLQVKGKRVQALNSLITISEERLDLKSKDLKDIQKLIKQQSSEVGVMHKRRDSMKLSIQKLAIQLDAKEMRHKEILEAISKSSSEMESIKNQIKSEEYELTRLRKLIQDTTSELSSRRDKVDKMKREFELKKQSEENELTRLRKSIQDLMSELSSRKDQVEAMKNNIQREHRLKKQLRQTSSVLVRHEQQPVSAPVNDTNQQNAIETELDIEDALTHHETSDLLDCDDVSSVLKDSLNPAEFVLELVEEQIREEMDLHDSLMANWVLLFEELAKIQRSHDPQVQLRAKQVATLWKKKIATRAPKSYLEVLAFLLFIVTYRLKILLHTEFILELVEEEIKGIREEVDLHDSLMRKWVLLFEELAKVQRSDDPQVQHKATQVATLWKRKIAIEAPKSSLEVLAFLMFVVEYGLKEVINEEETALLASSIAQYEQSPRLFISLGLKREIRGCVKDLIKKGLYIPAVRLICLHKLNEEFLPSQLLRREIINLKQSALEGKDKDAGRVRAIVELVAIYKLEIDLPGDLVVKLVVQKEDLTPPVVQCNVKYGNSLNSASAQRSSMSLRVPKFEVKPYLNP